MEKTKLKEVKSRQRDYRIGITLPKATIDALLGVDKEKRDKTFSKILEGVLDTFTPPTTVEGAKFSRVQLSRRYGAGSMIFFKIDANLHGRKDEAIASIKMRGGRAYFNELIFKELIKKFGA